MLAQLKRRRESDEGFTLIELMVVVLIIAILVAIAVPTFLGARERAQDRSAQSSARNALTAGRIHFTDEGNFDTVVGDFVTSLTEIEGGLTFAADESTGPNDVSVFASEATGDTIAGFDYSIYAVLSDSGTCYAVRDWSGNAGTVAVGAGPGETGYYEGTPADCDAEALDTAGVAFATDAW